MSNRNVTHRVVRYAVIQAIRDMGEHEYAIKTRSSLKNVRLVRDGIILPTRRMALYHGYTLRIVVQYVRRLP